MDIEAWRIAGPGASVASSRRARGLLRGLERVDVDRGLCQRSLSGWAQMAGACPAHGVVSRECLRVQDGVAFVADAPLRGDLRCGFRRGLARLRREAAGGRECD